MPGKELAKVWTGTAGVSKEMVKSSGKLIIANSRRNKNAKL